MSTETELKKIRASVMNAVHDLAVLVARDEVLFEAEGLDGASRSTASSQLWILGVGLFTAAFVLLTAADISRRLRARKT